MPSLKISGDEQMETDGCSKAVPAVAEDSQVPRDSDPAKEDPGM